jgi:hypothetical protein
LPALQKLVDLGGPSIGTVADSKQIEIIPSDLRDLFRSKNGFYCFEAALLIRPLVLDRGDRPANVAVWNEESLWRRHYGDLLSPEVVCFGEDAFGDQFALDPRQGFFFFDAETGERKPMGASLEDWAGQLLVDWDYWSGYHPAHEWQSKNRPLDAGERLIPRRPFVLGGEYKSANLMPWPDDKGMRSRAFLARQLLTIPDGAQISFELTE